MNTGADFNSVPYRQIPQLITDLLGGRIQLYFGAGEPLISLIKEGKLKAYAITGMKRAPELSERSDHGRGWITATHVQCKRLDRPSGAGRDARRRIDKLNAAINESLNSAEAKASLVQARLGGNARAPRRSSPPSWLPTRRSGRR